MVGVTNAKSLGIVSIIEGVGVVSLPVSPGRTVCPVYKQNLVPKDGNLHFAWGCNLDSEMADKVVDPSSE